MVNEKMRGDRRQVSKARCRSLCGSDEGFRPSASTTVTIGAWLPVTDQEARATPAEIAAYLATRANR